MALETNRDIRREAFILFQQVVIERLESGNMLETARSCILAIKTFQQNCLDLYKKIVTWKVNNATL